MKQWYGAAGVCISELGKILMVKQGLPGEKKLWTIPSGEKNHNETYEACCIREIKEETGYEAGVMKPLFIKESMEGVSGCALF
ncbi:NUDIX hydrolase [Lentibacillus sp. N15]|uniref:NUDIX hydrolase n=1 Tax=Lentibacillus songyuanensis TaxID=3136161 RepID=UPI0031BAE79E